MADDDERNYIVFFRFKVGPSGHLGPKVDAFSCPQVLERLHWLVQYSEKEILLDWIDSHDRIRGNLKATACLIVNQFSGNRCIERCQ